MLRLLMLMLASAGSAPAQPRCAAEGQSFVILALAAAEGDAAANQALLDVVRDLLQAQLAQRRVRVCVTEQEGAASPWARVVISLERASSSRITSAQIDIDDSRTRKQVSRHVELLRSTADSVPLALAVSIDELLRTSWAEPSPPTDGRCTGC